MTINPPNSTLPSNSFGSLPEEIFTKELGPKIAGFIPSRLMIYSLISKKAVEVVTATLNFMLESKKCKTSEFQYTRAGFNNIVAEKFSLKHLFYHVNFEDTLDFTNPFTGKGSTLTKKDLLLKLLAVHSYVTMSLNYDPFILGEIGRCQEVEKLSLAKADINLNLIQELSKLKKLKTLEISSDKSFTTEVEIELGKLKKSKDLELTIFLPFTPIPILEKEVCAEISLFDFKFHIIVDKTELSTSYKVDLCFLGLIKNIPIWSLKIDGKECKGFYGNLTFSDSKHFTLNNASNEKVIHVQEFDEHACSSNWIISSTAPQYLATNFSPLKKIDLDRLIEKSQQFAKVINAGNMNKGFINEDLFDVELLSKDLTYQEGVYKNSQDLGNISKQIQIQAMQILYHENLGVFLVVSKSESNRTTYTIFHLHGMDKFEKYQARSLSEGNLMIQKGLYLPSYELRLPIFPNPPVALINGIQLQYLKV